MSSTLIQLPPPRLKGELSVEEAIYKRKSARRFSPTPISIQEVAQLLWAAYGTIDNRRTIPSAGATYPLEIYLAASRVEELDPGVYKYLTRRHALELVKKGDVADRLAAACSYQMIVERAAANVVIAALSRRTTAMYGERGIRYVLLEAGHAGQNIYLQAEALNLRTVAIGAFNDSEVRFILGMPRELVPIYVFPVGKPREEII